MTESSSPARETRPSSLMTEIRCEHSGEAVEVFRTLLPSRQQGVATIHRVECSVHTYSDLASVRAVFTGVKHDGRPFSGAVSRHLGYVGDDWLPVCFPDSVARHLAQRLLDARRDGKASSPSPFTAFSRPLQGEDKGRSHAD